MRGGQKCGSYPRLPEGLTPHSQTDDKRRPASPCYTTASATPPCTAYHALPAQKGAVGSTVGTSRGCLLSKHRAESGIYMRHAGIASGRTDYTGIYYRGAELVEVGYTHPAEDCRASKLQSLKTRSESASEKQLHRGRSNFSAEENVQEFWNQVHLTTGLCL